MPGATACEAPPGPPGARGADVAVAVVLALGTALWGGLVAGQVGRFAAVPTAIAAVVLSLAAFAGLRRHHGHAGVGAGRWYPLDAALVFVAAATFLSPGYDATMHASDATVYFATGEHLAATGNLAVDDPLLAQLPRVVQRHLFPPYGLGIRQRSLAGLVHEDFAGPVWSTFSQLPAVWLALGFGLGGLTGACLVTPLLAAGGVAMVQLLVSRLGGRIAGLVTAGLLAPGLPEVSFARLPMGESGAQLFLWGALVAYARWCETRAPLAGTAAGLGLGLAALARPEYGVFVPLAVALPWVVGRPLALPRYGVAAALATFVHAALLLVVVVPTHYRLAAYRFALAVPGGWWGVGTGALLLGLTGAALAARGRGRWARMPAIVAVVAWAALYAGSSTSAAAGRGLGWLRFYTGWPVLVATGAGLLPLAVRWSRHDAGRLAFTLALVVAVHFLGDPHTAPLPVWASRRLLPAVLPVLFAAAGLAVAWVAARTRVGATVLAAGLLLANARPAESLWRARYFVGGSDAVAALAAVLPPDAVVLIDGGLHPLLLDVPLLLVHRRGVLQLRGALGEVQPLLNVYRAVRDRPLYLVRPSLLAAPRHEAFRFALVAEVPIRLALPGETGPILRDVRVFRADRLPPPRT